MSFMSELVQVKGGIPQSRIKESMDVDAPAYFVYGKSEMKEDLTDGIIKSSDVAQIRTKDEICTLEAGDVVFNLVSGESAVVKSNHDGYVITHNYAKLTPSDGIDSGYLAYLLNENDGIKHQLQGKQQGSATLKYTIKQLCTLQLPRLPEMGMQNTIGELYCNQSKMTALKKRVAILESTSIKERMKKAGNHE